jgi:ABC-type oligopeptide transport system ATPase subunit
MHTHVSHGVYYETHSICTSVLIMHHGASIHHIKKNIQSPPLENYTHRSIQAGQKSSQEIKRKEKQAGRDPRMCCIHANMWHGLSGLDLLTIPPNPLAV